METMVVPEEKLKSVCKIGQGADCCRYLACGTNGFECLKNTAIKTIIDARTTCGTMVAQGDNCDGM